MFSFNDIEYAESTTLITKTLFQGNIIRKASCKLNCHFGLIGAGDNSFLFL